MSMSTFARSLICRYSQVLLSLVAFLTLGLGLRSGAQEAVVTEEVFSGPQVGEPLPGFVFRQALGDSAGQELDLVAQADGSPIVLLFVHEANRPSIALTRALTRYASERLKDGLVTGVVLLSDDPAAAEANLKRMQHALTPNVPTGVSLDGLEGPGAYGLNRKMQLTILVGKQGRVTANYALVQPSLQADLPKIIRSIVDQVGGEMPNTEQLMALAPGMRQAEMKTERGGVDQDQLRGLLRPLIQKTASDEQVDAAAAAIESKIEADPAISREIGRIASTIVGSGKLENYGTPRAQSFLKSWAEKYGPRSKKP